MLNRSLVHYLKKRFEVEEVVNNDVANELVVAYVKQASYEHLETWTGATTFRPRFAQTNSNNPMLISPSEEEARE